MSKIKELVDTLNYERPPWLLDAEYQEWLEWAERPVIYDKDDTEESE